MMKKTIGFVSAMILAGTLAMGCAEKQNQPTTPEPAKNPCNPEAKPGEPAKNPCNP
jgi:hypothetical protein